MSDYQDQFVAAISRISDCIKCANINTRGKMPVLVTVQFVDSRDEAEFYSWLKMGKQMIDYSPLRVSPLRDCQFFIDGLSVRLSSDQRVDDAVRRLFK